LTDKGLGPFLYGFNALEPAEGNPLLSKIYYTMNIAPRGDLSRLFSILPGIGVFPARGIDRSGGWRYSGMGENTLIL